MPFALSENSSAGANDTVAPVVPMGMTRRWAFCHSGLILHVDAALPKNLPYVAPPDVYVVSYVGRLTKPPRSKRLLKRLRRTPSS